MNRLFELFEKLRTDKKAMQRLYLISLASALLILAIIVKAGAEQQTYIVDGNGNLVGIQRESVDEAEVFYVYLTLEDEGASSTREITINKSAIKNKKSQNKTKETSAVEREAEINGLVTEIELSKNKKIYFPTSLSDGTKLSWKIRKDSNRDYLIIPIIWIALAIVIIKTSFDENADNRDKYRKMILKSLPRFTNQLLLMLNAGMILSDSVTRIAECYKLIPSENRTIFEQEIINVNENNADHRISTAMLIQEIAGKFNVKELLRIATILTENERRGSDVIENLNRESNFLWENRKMIAREKGKMIDTKMTLPLSILLILLILITMAPTILSI